MSSWFWLISGPSFVSGLSSRAGGGFGFGFGHHGFGPKPGNMMGPNVTAPPNFIKTRVADLIRNNWK